MTGLRTYSHLASARRRPTEYEIVTTDLLYYIGRGFEVEVPLAAWYRKNQRDSRLSCPNWGQFRDPRETTYSRYTSLQESKEAHVDGILRSIEQSRYDDELDPEWRRTLEHVLPPARYLVHALQMAAAYVGQMAPNGRITIAAAFQAADEMRRVQRIAYRMALARRTKPTFGDCARDRWQRHENWQPLRRLAEELLVTYDWGESFAALNLCIKPVLDALFTDELAVMAARAGDHVLGQILFSLGEDCAWHREWSMALCRVAIDSEPANRAALAPWIGRWFPQAVDAATALARELAPDGEPARRAKRTAETWLGGLGLLP